MARFAQVSGGEVNALVEKKDAKNTQKQMDVLFNVLTSFIPEQISKVGCLLCSSLFLW